MTKDEQWLLDEKYGGTATPEFEADRERLAQGEPLAYVIGHQPFLGLDIYLDSRPLIPRPETEWWTEQLLSMLVDSPTGGFSVALRAARPSPTTENPPIGSLEHEHDGVLFLDLCAGSGAIGCAALAKLPNARVYFGEIDPAHEATIRKNIRENRLDDSRASVGIGDLFEPFGTIQFDVIAANPPYVPATRVLPRSVAEYEPPLALLAGNDGLDYIRRIAAELPERLAPNGVAWVECDRGHAEEARELFEKQGFDAEIHTDQYGKPRVIVVSYI